MTDAQVRNKIQKKKSSRRSKKKRRTEDFSSDSSSDSSDSEQEQKTEDAEQLPDASAIIEQDRTDVADSENLTIDGLSIPKNASNATAKDLDQTKLSLQNLDTLKGLDKLEATILTGASSGKLNLSSVTSKINENRETLLNSYLTKMLGNYGDDLDELRQKKDFNGSMSLTLLAKLLKESGNIFDDETLKSIVEN